MIVSFGDKNTTKEKKGTKDTKTETVAKKVVKNDPKPDKKMNEIEKGEKAIKERQTKIFHSRSDDELPDLNLLDKASDEKIGNSHESMEAMSRLLELNPVPGRRGQQCCH